MFRNVRFVPIALLLAAAVTACGSSDEPDTSDPGATTAEIALADEGTGGASGAEVLARFTSCNDVAPVVAEYIAGLQESESNVVDEYGVSCNWEILDGVTDLSQIRSVEVLVEPGTGEVPTAQDLETGKLVVLPDTDLERAGAVAYTLPVTTAVAGVTVTTVVTPDVKVTITGGQWDDVPSLDGPAAVAAAKELIGAQG